MTQDLVEISDAHKSNWANIIAFGLFHLGAIAAFFMFSWHALAVALFLYWMCTGLGISMGYHRLHTHRSYRVPLALEYFFAVCGALTLEGGPIFGWRLIASTANPTFLATPLTRDGGWWATWVGFWSEREAQQHSADGAIRAGPGEDRFYVWLNDYH
jgi:stearoyl-CoA desaturase (delta-9 desaturase)